MTFRKRFATALADVNLPDARKILGSYPHELSGGTLQRVMIALTLLQRPKLIIADEITTAVDAASEYLILNELEKLKKSGVSMIVVTHDFGVAAKICDRVAVMKDGEIIETGKAKDVFTKPRTNIPGNLFRPACCFRRNYAESRTYTKQYSLPDSGHTVFDAVSDVSLELKDGCVSSLVGKAEVEKALWQESCPTLSCLTLEKCFLVIWRSLL